MVDSVLFVNTKISSVDTVETVYTSPSTSQGTKLTALTVANSSGSSVSYKAYIYAVSGEGDPIVPLKIVVKDRFDSAPSAINQVIPSGGTLRIENSTADSLSFTATGIVQ